MCEPVDPEKQIRDITKTVCAMVEVCTPKGSLHRIMARCVAEDVRRTIDDYLPQVIAEARQGRK